MNYTGEMSAGSKDSQCFFGAKVSEPKKRLGLLGGTFDPPHIGHLKMADIARQEFSLSGVLVIPDGDPPHKRRTELASKEERRVMAALLAAERPYLSLCELELLREGYTYTYDTLGILNNALPDIELYYIIGSDTLFLLSTWRNWRQVLGLVGFIVIPRPGDDIERIYARAENYTELGGRMLVAKQFGPDISSTRIREMIREGSFIGELVPDNIRSYLEARDVYKG